MIFEYDKIEEKEFPNFKGGEKALNAKMFSDENGKILLGRLTPGATVGMHTHETSSEMIYILSGTATYIYDGVEEVAHAGSCHYCPKGHTHTMMNKEDVDLTFFAVIPEQ